MIPGSLKFLKSNIKKIEMEIFKDGKNIGYCNYEFTKNDDSIKIYNETNFEVKLLGIKVFSINSIGTEIYKNNKLFSFNSNTLQNDKKKFVNLILNKDESVSENKKLDFEIWLEPKKNLILKVKYNRMGSWEYILKNVIFN